ncbi:MULTISPECIES: Tn3 family transposase [Streptosporangium]|uniref:Tn3 transposase DDE domain-containing protein n=1 Tax=Streptosporangium brasiliense TaxID=47480 RepID=A0ABT9RIS0_9ACTN|nr:hypothetical protein [Streptosporangium brasiliense]
MRADYGPFTDVARGRIDLGRIERHREDIPRIVGAIRTGAARACEVTRMLSRDGRSTPSRESRPGVHGTGADLGWFLPARAWATRALAWP